MAHDLIISQAGNTGNYVQLIVLVLVFGFSALSWVFRKLGEQRAKKRAQDIIEQRKLEALRTGRSVEIVVVEDDKEIRAREQAARRRAQIEELRRRQQERMRAQGSRVSIPPAPPTVPPVRTPPTRPLPPIIRVPGSSGPTVPQRPARPREIRPVPVPRPQRAAPVQQERKRPQQSRPSRRVPEPTPETPRVPASAAPSVAPVAAQDAAARPATPMLAGMERPRTAAEWRRAIVLNELLSPPKAMRDPDQEAGSPLQWPAGGPPPGDGGRR